MFSCEPQRRHFAEYLTGLMIAHNKTITRLNGEFAETTDQSCLNRFITEVDWKAEDSAGPNRCAVRRLAHPPHAFGSGDAWPFSQRCSLPGGCCVPIWHTPTNYFVTPGIHISCLPRKCCDDSHSFVLSHPARSPLI